MIILAIDVGIKNLCIVIADHEEIKLAKVYQLGNNYMSKVIEILKEVTLVKPDLVLIEKQLNRNIKCLKVEVAIESYCIITGLDYKKVHPKDKYKKYQVSFEKYNERKKWVVEVGTNIYKDFFNYSIDSFKKKDDLCDCIIMIHLELNTV